MPRFRIQTLLILTAIVGIGVFLWIRYITPNVDSVSIEGNNLVIHMTSTYADNSFHLDPNDPYALPIPGPAPFGSRVSDPFRHDTFVSFYISLWTIVALVAILLGMMIGCWLFAKWVLRRRKRGQSPSLGA